MKKCWFKVSMLFIEFKVKLTVLCENCLVTSEFSMRVIHELEIPAWNWVIWWECSNEFKLELTPRYFKCLILIYCEKQTLKSIDKCIIYDLYI